jgi:L-aminopeptidase/D-esterase-like protein
MMIIRGMFLVVLLILFTAAPALSNSALQVIPLSSVPGIKVGHVTDLEKGTGCSVMIVEDPAGAVCGVDVRGRFSTASSTSGCW